MIELAEVIGQLRSELEAARAAAAGENLQFGLGPVELEVSVALARELGGGGKVRFWVAELGSDGRVSAAAMQRIKLTLTPQLAALTPQDDPVPGTPPVAVAVGGSQASAER
jgi:hypothetical protein